MEEEICGNAASVEVDDALFWVFVVVAEVAVFVPVEDVVTAGRTAFVVVVAVLAAAFVVAVVVAAAAAAVVVVAAAAAGVVVVVAVF